MNRDEQIMKAEHADQIEQYISKLDQAAGRMIVSAMSNPEIKEAMEMVQQVSYELGVLVSEE